MLRSDKAATNFSDRTLLKNLGHWLGLCTIGKNRPIIKTDLDLKSLLLEAYFKGQQDLLFVVPFIAKVMESIENSKVWNNFEVYSMKVLSKYLSKDLQRENGLDLAMGLINCAQDNKKKFYFLSLRIKLLGIQISMPIHRKNFGHLGGIASET